jgi:succinate dehydrogenase/fumarate reductase flavoprotein subunit
MTKIVDGDGFELFSANPEMRTSTWIRDNGDGTATLRKTIMWDPYLDANSDARAEGAGMAWGDGKMVSSVPLGYALKTGYAQAIREGRLKPTDLPEEKRDYYLERRYPAFGNLVPRDVASRAAKERCDEGHGVNATGEAVYLDFAFAIERYGNEVKRLHGVLE